MGDVIGSSLATMALAAANGFNFGEAVDANALASGDLLAAMKPVAQQDKSVRW